VSSGYRVGNYGLAQAYAALIGVVLVVVGLLGFIGNPIVGEPAGSPLFVTGTMHNVVHLLTGAIALYIAFGLSGRTQVQSILYFGALYAVIFVGLLVSPNLFGILGDARYNVNVYDHVLHAGLAVISFAVWYLARQPARAMAR
jgi:hypothetical protein